MTMATQRILHADRIHQGTLAVRGPDGKPLG